VTWVTPTTTVRSAILATAWLLVLCSTVWDFASAYKILRKSHNTLLSYGRPKTTFYNMASVHYLEFKSLVLFKEFQLQNFIKIWWYLTENSDRPITIFKIAIVRHLGFPYFENFHISSSLLSHFASSYKISRKSDNISDAELHQKRWLFNRRWI